VSHDDAAARWERLKDLFELALERGATEREALLARTLAEDAALADELSGLLAAHESAHGFMDAPTRPAGGWGEPDATGAAQPDPPGPSRADTEIDPLPETFGRYRIRRLLGAGGMGRVFLAHEPALGRDVALKVLPASLAHRPEARDALLREARAAAGLNHPNITAIHEIGSVAERDYICFEYVRGRTLRERLAAGPLPLAELLAVGHALADALAFAHERGVIHRDVKPGNVMLDERGRPMLLDFGLATSLRATGGADASGATGRTGSTGERGGASGASGPAGPAAVDVASAAALVDAAGTPAAMSPEQVRGEPLDARSDVFSFGSLLYELAAGRPAFAGRDVQHTLDAVLHRAPAPLATLRPELPADFATLVETALAKEPAARIQSMADIAAALRRMEREVDRAPARRRSRLALVALALAGLVAATLVGLQWSARGTAPHQVIAVTGFLDPEDPGDAQRIGAMLARLVTSHLAAGSGLEVVSEQQLFEAARRTGSADGRIDPAHARAVAERAGADTMVLGRFGAEGGALVATADLVELESGRTLATLQARGSGQAEVFTMADSLAHQIRAALKEPALSADVRQALADQLTTSVDAYRAFVRGLEALLRNEPRGAVAALREATAIDPAFALAQYRLWMALIWTGEFEESTLAMQRALAFRDKLPSSLGQVLDALGPDPSEQDDSVILPRLEQVLAGDPDNSDALYLAGEIYTHSALRSDSGRAAATYEQLLALDPGLSLVYDHRLQALLRLGRWEEARAQLAAWAPRAPADLAALQGTLALWEGRLDEAARLLPDPLAPDVLSRDAARASVQAVLASRGPGLPDELAEVHGAYLVLALDLRADVLVLFGRFDEAAQLYREASVVPGLVSRDNFHTSLRNGARQRLACLLALRGELPAARAQTQAALELQPDSARCLYFDALLALRAGDTASADDRLLRLDVLVDRRGSPATPLYREALAAELALAAGHVEAARAGFSALVASGRLMEDWYVHEDSLGPWVRDGLARAALAAGDAAAAEEAWAALTAAGLERLRAPIPWVLSLFRRGQLAVQQGRSEQGRALLEEFVAQWGAAGDLPEVVAARELLAR